MGSNGCILQFLGRNTISPLAIPLYYTWFVPNSKDEKISPCWFAHWFSGKHWRPSWKAGMQRGQKFPNVEQLTAIAIWKRSTKTLFNLFFGFFTHVTHVMQLLGGGLAMRICGLQPLDWLNFWETAQVELSPSDEKNSWSGGKYQIFSTRNVLDSNGGGFSFANSQPSKKNKSCHKGLSGHFWRLKIQDYVGNHPLNPLRGSSELPWRMGVVQ